MSQCFSGQPPSDVTDGHLRSRMTHLSPTSQSFSAPPLGAPAGAPPPLTDMERDQFRATQGQAHRLRRPSGQNINIGFMLHRWFLVLEGELGNESVGFEEYRPLMVIAAVWLWGSGSPRVVFNDWWAKRVPVTEGELNHARSFIRCCSLPMTFRFHRAECVCVCALLRHLKPFVKIHLSSVQARLVCN